MPLPSDLLSILVCPESKSPLVHVVSSGEEEFLFCPASRLKYRVEDGIPVMLVEEAERLSPAEAEKLLAGQKGSLA